ncbi:DUF2167 domain-containing protein [Antarcticimicrobium sediminis]|uniref:DUF2167 domain-containing protein n=1 Tax=Antarcticimicrobium sediminis TaxID=2546227 RepID=A0A4V2Z6T0_9RHOB|nr:DUF2167 domain-containing protein [Antarcticimicrobium sediminis]TDE33816.1 DUF2167 domain-containing protein [Antarcticimicrobium sediminis]
MDTRKLLNTLLRENLIFLVISFLIFNSEPAIVYAQGGDPYAFTEPLTVSRGKLMPSSQGAVKLPRDEMCDLVKTEWGWANCESVDVMVVLFTPQIDTLIIDKPNTSGYVKLDDWDTDEREDVISNIEDHLQASLKAQGERSGQNITFDGWRVYPTLNATKKYMYYATDIGWNGESTINVKAVVFDRRGFVAFSIVPVDSNMNEPQMVTTINAILDKYQPKPQEEYSAFSSGDKVAAVGAVGVLASLVGVKYGKGAATGLLVVLTLLLKKAWLILLFPFYWVWRWVKRLFEKSE